MKEYSVHVESELQRFAQLSNTVESKGNEEQSKFAKEDSVQVETELQRNCTVAGDTVESSSMMHSSSFSAVSPSALPSASRCSRRHDGRSQRQSSGRAVRKGVRPLYHIGGIITNVFSLMVSGASLVCAPSLRMSRQCWSSDCRWNYAGQIPNWEHGRSHRGHHHE